MKKLMLTLLSAVVSSSAMAKWIDVATDTNETILSADPAAIRRSGEKIVMYEPD